MTRVANAGMMSNDRRLTDDETNALARDVDPSGRMSDDQWDMVLLVAQDAKTAAAIRAKGQALAEAGQILFDKVDNAVGHSSAACQAWEAALAEWRA